jgi:hypothetical protein
MIKDLNRAAKRRRHGLSKAKVFTASTNNLRVLREEDGK